MATYASSQQQTATQIQFFRREPETADPVELRIAAGCELAESAFVGGELPETCVGDFIANFVSNRLEAAERLVRGSGASNSAQPRHRFNLILARDAPLTLGIAAPGFSAGAAPRPHRTYRTPAKPTGFWENVPAFIAHRPAARNGTVPVGYGLP